MSTYMYLTCLDHDPPLAADDESGQHYEDLPRIRQEIKDRAELALYWENGTLPSYHITGDVSHYFAGHSAKFLAKHPNCRIAIHTEYGEDVTSEDQS